MTESKAETILAGFSEEDATFKVLSALFSAIPGAPTLSFYRTLDEARMLLAPDLDDAALERARAFLSSTEATKAIAIADTIDTGDVGITVFSGIRSALTFFFGNKSRALETDPQQGADAVLKAGAIGYMTHLLFEGGVPEKVQRVFQVEAGVALLDYYAAVEIALPFADDAALGAGNIINRLLQKYGPANFARLESAAGEGSAAAAQGMLAGLLGPMDQTVVAVAQHSTRIAAAAQAYLPPAIATAGTVASAVAAAADALPLYRFLGARLVIEAALHRARATQVAAT